MQTTRPLAAFAYYRWSFWVGGLLSSTLLGIIVTPVVFHQFGRRALDAYIKNKLGSNFAVDDGSLSEPKPTGTRGDSTERPGTDSWQNAGEKSTSH